MKIMIAGGSGFIGNRLTEFFLEKGYRVTAMGTRSAHSAVHSDRFQYISADLSRKGPWQSALADVDVIINLAGKSIFQRWTKEYKGHIYASRILSTRNLVEGLSSISRVTLMNASACGYYGDRGNEILNEDEPPGNDFLAGVARDWEKEAKKGEEKGARVICARFGIVLGRGGGAIEKMAFPFKFFIGGPQGNGTQWFSWIHMDDLCSAMECVIKNGLISGPVNFCSPEPIQNRELSRILGKLLNRPSFMPTPGWMIRAILGEFGSSLLSSQRCVPHKLLDGGYRFKYPDPEGAIREIFQIKP
ncbi:MAG: TIGR01777 family oxidoreductase [Pseudomonadota bacterium]